MSGRRDYTESEIEAMFAGITFERELRKAGLLPDDQPCATPRVLAELEAAAEKLRQRRVPAELARLRAAGRAAYERAFAERGLPVPYVRAAIYASALPWLYAEEATGGR